jgi:DNA-binding HxlR family transcriptional regulator
MNPSKPNQEDVTPRELLEYLVSGHNALVLKLLRQEPVNQKIDLAERCDEISASAVSRIIKSHRQWGLVRHHPGRDQYEVTDYGESVWDIYDDLANVIGDEAVSLIAKSESTIPILRYLEGNSESLAALATIEEIPGERSTIARRRNDLEDAGWILRAPPYQSSQVGRVVMEAYAVFCDSTTRVINHELRVTNSSA